MPSKQEGEAAMKRMVLMAAAAALVAGCSGSGDADADGDGEVTLKEAAKQAEAEGLKPEPGLYRVVSTMTGIDIPGMPPEMAGHGAGATNTVEYCLMQEQVDKGFEEMVKRGQNGECAYESFKLADGNLDAVLVCKTPEGSARMEMEGDVTPTSAQYTATMAMNFGGKGEGTMTFTAKNERVGDCPAQ
jgi:Protein of unknown function (DUF3617)